VRNLTVVLASVALTAIGCGDDTATPMDLSVGHDQAVSVTTAKTTINEAGGAQGTVNFEQTSAGVKITIALTAVPMDGMHGIHIHATGDCGDSAADGGTTHHGAAGGHFNPDMVNHGCPPASPHHAGDLGNIMVTGGAANATIMSTDLTVAAGAKSVIGKAFMLHGGTDDCTSQPVGNSGARIGCGVIN